MRGLALIGKPLVEGRRLLRDKQNVELRTADVITSSFDPARHADHEQQYEPGDTSFRKGTYLLERISSGVERVLYKANIISTTEESCSSLRIEGGNAGMVPDPQRITPAIRAADLSVRFCAFLPAKASSPPRTAVRWQVAQ